MNIFIFDFSGIPKDIAMGYITDAANVMKASAADLQNDESKLFEKMHYLTCVAHGLNNVANESRKQFKKADYVIMTVKSVFVKAPKRRKLLRQNQPNLKTPPSPVVTRWCTWLEAVTKFYAIKENCTQLAKGLSHIRDVEISPRRQIELLELQEKKLKKKLEEAQRQAEERQTEERADPCSLQKDQLLQQQLSFLEQQLDMMEHQIQAVQYQQQVVRKKKFKKQQQPQTQEQDNIEFNESSWEKQYSLLRMFDELILALESKETAAEFKFINDHLSCIVAKIRKFETESLPAREAVEILDSLGAKLNTTVGMPQSIKAKFKSVFEKNEGYVVMRAYFKDGELRSPLDKWSDEELKLLDFFPVTTSPVERNFSVYKIMLRSNRCRFKFKNFKKYVVSKCILQQLQKIRKKNEEEIEDQNNETAGDVSLTESESSDGAEVDANAPELEESILSPNQTENIDEDFFFVNDGDELQFVQQLVLEHLE